MKGYIYKILNKENNKFYIGSTIEPKKRQKRHSGMMTIPISRDIHAAGIS